MFKIKVAFYNVKSYYMSENSLKRNLYRALRKTGICREDICINSSLRNDFRFDESDWKIFAYYLEDIFQIKIRDDELYRLCNVKDAFLFVKAKL